MLFRLLDIASVVPIYKNSGERNDPINYRPNSLLPLFAKIFESLINHILIRHLTNKLLSYRQYGFKQSRITADILTVISEHTKKYEAQDKAGEARAVALDISKAFDRVWHDGLLIKSNHIVLLDIYLT